MQLYQYKCKVVNIVDGDTIDVDIDLGFGVWLQNERVRLEGIDCPEVRTRDLTEKVFGNAATQRVVQYFENATDIILVSKAFKGKFGRILGDFQTSSSPETSLCQTLLNEHWAVVYSDDAEERQRAHLANREMLLAEGKVTLP